MLRSVSSVAPRLVFLFTSLAHALAATPRTLIATVQCIGDGDTLVALSSNGTKLHIRLIGIDTHNIAHGTKPRQGYDTSLPGVFPPPLERFR